jgi:demethoxyubiquinone hydroxylase (CLK1/Coq7/Cat5 family)
MLVNLTRNQSSGFCTEASSLAFIRRHGLFDALIAEADMALQVLWWWVGASRPNPAGVLGADAAGVRREAQKRHAAGLMRVNHVGRNMCAGALSRTSRRGQTH